MKEAFMKKKLLSCVVLILPFIATYLLTSGQLERIPEQKNMALLGFNDPQAGPAYQPLLHKYPDGRWIFFSRHHAGTAFNP
jgi:hypothetical protein